MPDLQLQLVNTTNREDYLRVRADVYLRGVVEEPGDLFERAVDRYVGYWNSQAVAITSSIRYLGYRLGAELPMAGVASVGVSPEARHLGVGSQLMTRQLSEMKRQGFLVAALYGFREAFYRKFGYEFVGGRWELKVPSHRMPNLSCELEPKRISPEELDQLDACYQAFARSLSGANLRSPEQWKLRMGLKPPMIYAFGDPVEAYCWTSMEGGFWDDLSFGEVVWSTRRGYESMLGFMRGLVINRSHAIWSEPTHGPFLASFLDQGIKVELDRPAMYRVLDVPGALRKLKPEASGEFVLEVFDPLIPENNGPWKVVFRPGHVEVEPTKEAAGLRCEIKPWTQAFFGEPSLAQLHRHGWIQADSDAVLKSAMALLPAQSVFCTEFF